MMSEKLDRFSSSKAALLLSLVLPDLTNLLVGVLGIGDVGESRPVLSKLPLLDKLRFGDATIRLLIDAILSLRPSFSSSLSSLPRVRLRLGTLLTLLLPRLVNFLLPRLTESDSIGLSER